ncbi:hypothetical protein [Chryseobacterium sp. EO14]|uniref:hypothetical protein n=1 Tax=Chryseobacterium sp. EO14 TaxID=2950551 RepID=UPI00210AFF0B|nr:hypothetical protein [Chryseobacterium sp. EO14]MCQ4139224.1 hypothetical protein [Chryseobacterium sp. EO14]
MTTEEKCLKLIELLKYNQRQAAEVLGIATQTVDKKMKHTNNNKFTEDDVQKFLNYIDLLQAEAHKL